MVRLAGIEPAQNLAPEASALSPELQAHILNSYR
jgi:hypothetical protein